MSDAMEKAFEQATQSSPSVVVRQSRSSRRHMLPSSLRTERRAIKDELKAEKLSWKQEQKAMREQMARMPTRIPGMDRCQGAP